MEINFLSFSLDPRNLRNIPFHKYDNNFTFIVNDKKYETNRYIADLLSPSIRQMHYTDESFNEFILDTINFENEITENSETIDYFQDFLDLTTFQHYTIDSEHQKRYMEYFYNLGNVDEYYRIQHDFFHEITIDNAIDSLISIIKIISSISQEFKEQKNPKRDIINYIAYHFEDIDKDQLINLDSEVLEEIISNESLRLNNEDSLFDFILSLYKDDQSYSNLFEYIQFSNISEDSLLSFIEIFEISNINEKIWNSICDRLLPTSSKNKKLNMYRYLPEYIEFKYTKGKDLNGILHHLSKETEGNIHDKGIIQITSNSVLSHLYHPKNLVDFHEKNYYHSKDDGNAFVCFDFIDKLVQLSSYSIKSMHNKFHYSQLKNWVIEVSNDNKNWKIIDNHVNDPALDEPGIVYNFTINKKNIDFYRFIRIRQTGNSWDPRENHNFIGFYFIEFFGKLIESNSNELE